MQSTYVAPTMLAIPERLPRTSSGKPRCRPNLQNSARILSIYSCRESLPFGPRTRNTFVQQLPLAFYQLAAISSRPPYNSRDKNYERKIQVLFTVQCNPHFQNP